MGHMNLAMRKAIDTTATAAMLTNATNGLAAGYKVARGTESVTGITAPAIATGLTTIVSACCSLRADPVMANNMWTSCTWAGAALTLKTWRPTGAADATPLAGNAATNVDWVAVGTV